LGFTLFGIGISALFAVASLDIRERVEEQLVNSSLMDDAKYANEFAVAHPDAPGAASRLLTGMVKSERTLYKAPLAWQKLQTGVHDITESDPDDNGKDHYYKLAVYRSNGIISFIRYDVSRERLGGQQLVIAVSAATLILGVLSFALGSWLAGRVIKPVTLLARRLRESQREGSSMPLAHGMADDEVGELARALDDYAGRLREVVDRDREFNSDVSHELRTPLAVIASTTELLQGAPDLSTKMQERLLRLQRSSRQATELIEALLLLSRAERRGPTRGESTEVARVASDVIESQLPQMRDKLLKVDLVEIEPVVVNAPASVLSVALTNIIGNAIKYTLEGGIQVAVGGNRIEVIDTGPGIKSEEAERLFQRGYQSNSGSTGAGLGLAIVRRLCDLYDWRVSIHPRPDTHGAITIIRFGTTTS